MNNTCDVIPCVSIHPARVNLFNRVEHEYKKPPRERAAHLINCDNKTHGKVSYQARRKVAKGVEYLLFMANDKLLPDTAHGKSYRFKVAFLTLTLPSTQIHADNIIKEKCLNQFLVELRQRFHVVNYIWRAEKQKNGNIHFHILVDKFIPWSELRDRWNRITNKLGYVDRYREQMRAFHQNGFQVRQKLLKEWSYKAQVKAYQKGKANDWNSPNSTDVHSLFRINSVGRYITKYCTKDETSNEVDGRIWGCNYELTDLRGGVDIASQDVKSEVNTVISRYQDKVYSGDYFTVIHIPVQELFNLGCHELYGIFCNYMLEQFNFNVQSTFNTS
jgi:hypothetical protein